MAINVSVQYNGGRAILASFGKYFILSTCFAQMFPFGIFICIEDPVRTSDVFGGGPDMTRHGVAMSLALIGLKIHRIFARRTHTTHAHTQKKGSPGSAPLYSRHRPQLPGPKIIR